MGTRLAGVVVAVSDWGGGCPLADVSGRLVEWPGVLFALRRLFLLPLRLCV